MFVGRFAILVAAPMTASLCSCAPHVQANWPKWPPDDSTSTDPLEVCGAGMSPIAKAPSDFTCPRGWDRLKDVPQPDKGTYSKAVLGNEVACRNDRTGTITPVDFFVQWWPDDTIAETLRLQGRFRQTRLFYADGQLKKLTTTDLGDGSTDAQPWTQEYKCYENGKYKSVQVPMGAGLPSDVVKKWYPDGTPEYLFSVDAASGEYTMRHWYPSGGLDELQVRHIGDNVLMRSEQHREDGTLSCRQSRVDGALVSSGDDCSGAPR